MSLRCTQTTYPLRELPPFIAAGVVIIPLLVLLLDVVDAVLIANGHELRLGSQGVNNPYNPSPLCDSSNVVERILAPHDTWRFGELGNGHLQDGRKQDTWSPGAGRDLRAGLSILMEEVGEVLASMGYQVVQGLKELLNLKHSL